MDSEADKHMKEDLFANLPSDIIIDILLRLPIRTIINCKCVYKSWLALLQTPEFVKSHLLKAGASLTLYENTPKMYTIYEFEDGFDLENHELRYGSVIKFSVPFKYGWIGGSANGLFLQCYMGKPLTIYICNPITRDYIEICRPQELHYSCPRLAALGFGASKISGQYKVVTIFQDYEKIPTSECNCYVYTIGTGAWRKIAPPTGNLNGCRIIAVFLNGNLHWWVSDLKSSLQPWISCFDLENETFSMFSSPLMSPSNTLAVVLCALGDTLCLCNNRSVGTEIWLMKEYGVDKSWTKQFVINTSDFDQYSYEIIYPIKVSKDGDILVVWKLTNFLFYYSIKNNTVQNIDFFDSRSDTIPFFHAPTFLSLKTFENENVISF